MLTDRKFVHHLLCLPSVNVTRGFKILRESDFPSPQFSKALQIRQFEIKKNPF